MKHNDAIKGGITKAAKNVPEIIAKKVRDVKIPLAFEIFSLGTISGIIPYLDGPKIAL